MLPISLANAVRSASGSVVLRAAAVEGAVGDSSYDCSSATGFEVVPGVADVVDAAGSVICGFRLNWHG